VQAVRAPVRSLIQRGEAKKGALLPGANRGMATGPPTTNTTVAEWTGGRKKKLVGIWSKPQSYIEKKGETDCSPRGGEAKGLGPKNTDS